MVVVSLKILGFVRVRPTGLSYPDYVWSRPNHSQTGHVLFSILPRFSLAFCYLPAIVLNSPITPTWPSPSSAPDFNGPTRLDLPRTNFLSATTLQLNAMNHELMLLNVMLIRAMWEGEQVCCFLKRNFAYLYRLYTSLEWTMMDNVRLHELPKIVNCSLIRLWTRI